MNAQGDEGLKAEAENAARHEARSARRTKKEKK